MSEIGGRGLMRRAGGPYPFPTIPAWVRHFVALAAVAIASLASRTTPPVIDEGGLFLLMSITVLGAAWVAGAGSALAGPVPGARLGAACRRLRSTRAVRH